nr:DUF1540 domain-containing protein [uncultured Solibaculum sp.]
MHETHKQDCHCIQGIHCEVKNCVYHQKDDKCEAGKITVGPTFAVSSADTICSTFKAK